MDSRSVTGIRSPEVTKNLAGRGLGHHYRGGAPNPRLARRGETGMKVFVMAAIAGGFMALLPTVRTIVPSTTAASFEPRIVATDSTAPAKPHAPATKRRGTSRAAISNAALTQVVKQTCAASCHSEQRKLGSLSLEQFEVGSAA